MPDELDTVLRLVAEGHMTPEEAAPIIEALTATRHGDDRSRAAERLDRRMERVHRRIEQAHERVADARQRAEEKLAAGRLGMAAGRGRQLRIRVTEHGRQVVNLRIPIGFVDTALQFVPGLGGEQSQRIRDAVQSGEVGPILDVEDPDGTGGVLISVE